MITQHRWVTSGFLGGNGYYYFRVAGQLADTAAGTWLANLRTMISAWRVYIPSQITFTPDNQVTYIDETTGAIQGVLSPTTQPSFISCTGSGNYPAIAGACVIWRTGKTSVRRLRVGRTFIVPLSGSAYDATGAVSPAAASTIATAANTYLATAAPGAAGRAVVWHRPNKGAANGLVSDALTASCSGRSAELKTRRP
jgi:hypothetical protein